MMNVEGGMSKWGKRGVAMGEADGWLLVCDELVSDLLSEAGVTEPPVDALRLGRRLRMELAWDAAQAGRGRLMRRGDTTTILLKPEARPERVQWAAAHEIGEAQVWQLAARMGVDADDVTPRQREFLANGFAQRLLLPTRWFQAALQETGGDLHQLKQRFPTASHELIGWRLLDDSEFRVLSVWDGGSLTRRRGNLPRRCPPLTALEAELSRRLRLEGELTLEATDETGYYRGWAIHEPDWQREIVCWEPAFAEPVEKFREFADAVDL